MIALTDNAPLGGTAYAVLQTSLIAETWITIAKFG